MSEKRSTGPNARPKHETIAQSGEGLPDDAGGVPDDISETDEAAARRSLDQLGEAAKQRRQAEEPEEKEREALRAEGRARGKIDRER